MAFRFPLATVLQLRESIEEREERALQKIQAEIVLVENQIEALTARIANAHRERERALLQPMPAAHLHAMLGDAHAAAEKRKALLDALRILDQQRDQQMQVYQAAHRDRETLTNMSDEQRELYEQEQARTQQKNLDDIFIARRQRS
jgi:flagellar export protein FliJ